MFFSAKTIDCIINIIMWLFMQLVLAKGVINNYTGGSHQSVLFLEWAAAQMVADNKNQGLT